MPESLPLPSIERRIHVAEDGDHDDAVDRLSQLPNDVLIDCIVGRLSMKQAAKALSLTSKKFCHIWRHCKNIEFKSEDDPRALSTLCNFIHALQFHLAPYIDEFILNISKLHDPIKSRYLDDCVQFALCRRVQFLRLKFYNVQYCPLGLFLLNNAHAHYYTFGLHLINNFPAVSTGITFLRSLNLEGVNVNEECLEHLLSHCHNLEHLYVIGSSTLRRLSVTSSSLTSLHLYKCLNLAHVEIDAKKLCFFEFHDCTSETASILYKCVPCLVEAEFGGQCSAPPYPIFQKISFVAKQLTSLSIEVNSMVEIVALLQHEFVVTDAAFTTLFCNVKHLTLRLCDIKTLFVLWRFIDACPRLYKLTLQKMVLSEIQLSPSNAKRLVQGRLRFRRVNPLPSLVVLELAAFMGSPDDFVFILNVVDVALSLKTIIWDPHGGYYKTTSSDLIQFSWYRAVCLAKIIPPKVKLLVL